MIDPLRLIPIVMWYVYLVLLLADTLWSVKHDKW